MGTVIIDKIKEIQDLLKDAKGKTYDDDYLINQAKAIIEDILINHQIEQRLNNEKTLEVAA